MMRRFFPSTIRQVDEALPFVFEINTANTSVGSTTNTQFKLPLLAAGTYNMTVDWGDTTSDSITVFSQAETTHTYGSTGTYTITITGTCTGWNFANTGDRLKILDISQIGILRFISNTNINTGDFAGCANLQISATDPFVLPSGSAAFFRNCTALTGNTSFSDWDTTAVTDMNNMFRAAVNFNVSLNNWDVSKVEQMFGMFFGASAFNGNITNWNTVSVTNMGSMFQAASQFNQNIGGWNVSNVDTMLSMFQSASVFNQNIGSWIVSNVTNFGNMFFLASQFNQNIGIWNVSNAINMSQMFRSATAFNQNIGSWNVSKVANFVNFMLGKTNLNYSAANLDAIYNGWSLLTFVNTGLSISFSTIKYTAAGQAGRDILTGAPNNWAITDGGI